MKQHSSVLHRLSVLSGPARGLAKDGRVTHLIAAAGPAAPAARHLTHDLPRAVALAERPCVLGRPIVSASQSLKPLVSIGGGS